MKKTLTIIALSVTTMFAATVAEVNGQKIDETALIPTIQQMTQGRYAQLPAESQEQVKKIAIEQAIGQILIQAEAEAAGVKKSKAYKVALQETLERIEPQLAAEIWLKNEFEKVNVGSKEVETFYNENKDKFNAKKEVHARHVLVKKESEAKAIISILSKAKSSALKDAFIEEAKAKSTGPSAKTGGDLGFFSQGQMVPAFDKAVFAMKKNTYTKKPVKTQFGYHVIYLEDVRGGENKPFSELKPNVEQALKAKKFQDKLKQLIENLKSKSKISYK